MADNFRKPNKKRHGMKPFDPNTFQQLQQQALEDDQHRLEHDEEDLPTVWVYLPFKSGQQQDQRHMAESFIRERTLDNPREGKRYKLVEHSGGGGQLSDVKPNDTVYIFSHGAERDTNHIYTHDESGQLSVNGLVDQMLGVEGLDPTNVKMKLGNCYSAHTEHQTLEEAQSMETFTGNFTQSLSEKSVKKGMGVPQYVDGYIGGVQNQNVIVTPDGQRHRGANMPKGDKGKKIQSLELINLTTPDKVQEAAELTEPYRASDNRWRYRPQQTGVSSVSVNLDEEEFDRVSSIREQRRLEEERRLLEELTKKFGGMDMDKGLDKDKGKRNRIFKGM